MHISMRGTCGHAHSNVGVSCGPERARPHLDALQALPLQLRLLPLALRLLLRLLAACRISGLQRLELQGKGDAVRKSTNASITPPSACTLHAMLLPCRQAGCRASHERGQ